jgi:uncharacterized protein YggE
MTRTRIAVIGIVVLAVAVVGAVVISAQGSGSGSAAASTPTAVADTVSVSGTGSVEGVPDTLTANLRVHVSNLSSVQVALNAASADVRHVIGAVRAKGVAPSDIKTTDLSLNPHYDSHGVVTGYDSAESLTVRIHPLTKVGDVLSAAAPKSASNSVSINGLSFDIADNSSLLGDARKAAFDNAKAAAQQYATLGGRTLGHVVSIKAVVHNASPIFKGGYAAAGLSDTAHLPAPVPIRPGQKKISVTVKVVWALA